MKDDLYERIEPGSAPESDCTIELLLMASIAISLKRIADMFERAEKSRPHGT